jgi:glycosyltransferase involved in cell wall biosynthesis
MRVLVLHNRYRQLGGEDRTVAAEIAMLRAHGVDVVYHEADNSGGLIQLATSSAWSDDSFRTVQKLCREVRPDIAHVHNFWATLSPSVHAACYAAGVPTVQTLHNYRLFCVNALFLRNGAICTDCLGNAPWRGVVHRCYNHSALASAAVARMISSNRRRNTWANVDAFIAPSQHARSMFAAGGIDPARLHVKPNFAADPGPALRPPSASRSIVYAGRLSAEKGVRTLLAAWLKSGLGDRGQLVILGDGSEARQLSHDVPGVRFLGRQDAAAVTSAIENARAVVVPSLCFETFGNTVVEAYACSRPVIASDIGALGDLVDHDRTGLKFKPADETALADSLSRMLNDPTLADHLGSNAREEYLARFTPGRNFEMLNAIYEQVLCSEPVEKEMATTV